MGTAAITYFLVLCVLFEKGYSAWSPIQNSSIQWSYEREDLWPAQHCKDTQQSPINIVKRQATNEKFEKLKFSHNFKRHHKMTISNEDKTIVLSFKSKFDEVTVSGGPLLGEYKFYLMDFHWSESEHSINGKKYPLEAQLSFYNKKYKTPEKAVEHEDGFLNIVVFYKLSWWHNKLIGKLIDKVPQIENLGYKPVTLRRKISISELLPRNRKHYYTYHGSITKPYCEEIVTFIVFTKPLSLTKSQLSQLTQINDQGKRITRNYRDQQPLNMRTVYYNKGESFFNIWN